MVYHAKEGVNMKKTLKKSITIKPRKLTVSAPTRRGHKNEYETDFYKWANTQAQLLKNKEFANLDMNHLIEEIESLGRSEKRALTSYLEVFLMHKLKCKYQPGMHTTSWDLSIEESLHKAKKTLDDNPSLKPLLKSIIGDAYFSARLRAASETNLDKKAFPKVCEWSIKEIFPGLEKKYH
jgi:hypothetical protein